MSILCFSVRTILLRGSFSIMFGIIWDGVKCVSVQKL